VPPKSKTKAPTLPCQRDTCVPSKRTECFAARRPDGSAAEVTRCLECGAQTVK